MTDSNSDIVQQQLNRRITELTQRLHRRGSDILEAEAKGRMEGELERAKLVEEHAIMGKTLGSCQKRCTELMGAERLTRVELELQKIATRAVASRIAEFEEQRDEAVRNLDIEIGLHAGAEQALSAAIDMREAEAQREASVVATAKVEVGHYKASLRKIANQFGSSISAEAWSEMSRETAHFVAEELATYIESKRAARPGVAEHSEAQHLVSAEAQREVEESGVGAPAKGQLSRISEAIEAECPTRVYCKPQPIEGGEDHVACSRTPCPDGSAPEYTLSSVVTELLERNSILSNRLRGDKTSTRLVMLSRVETLMGENHEEWCDDDDGEDLHDAIDRVVRERNEAVRNLDIEVGLHAGAEQALSAAIDKYTISSVVTELDQRIESIGKQLREACSALDEIAGWCGASGTPEAIRSGVRAHLDSVDRSRYQQRKLLEKSREKSVMLSRVETLMGENHEEWCDDDDGEDLHDAIDRVVRERNDARDEVTQLQVELNAERLRGDGMVMRSDAWMAVTKALPSIKGNGNARDKAVDWIKGTAARIAELEDDNAMQRRISELERDVERLEGHRKCCAGVLAKRSILSEGGTLGETLEAHFAKAERERDDARSLANDLATIITQSAPDTWAEICESVGAILGVVVPGDVSHLKTKPANPASPDEDDYIYSLVNAMCPHCDEVTPVDGKCPNCGRPCDALPEPGDVYDGMNPDGKEAEELRAGIERLISEDDDGCLQGALQDLLDSVDARDSLDYLERKDAAHVSRAAAALSREVDRLKAISASRLTALNVRTAESDHMRSVVQAVEESIGIGASVPPMIMVAFSAYRSALKPDEEANPSDPFAGKYWRPSPNDEPAPDPASTVRAAELPAAIYCQEQYMHHGYNITCTVEPIGKVPTVRYVRDDLPPDGPVAPPDGAPERALVHMAERGEMPQLARCFEFIRADVAEEDTRKALKSVEDRVCKLRVESGTKIADFLVSRDPLRTLEADIHRVFQGEEKDKYKGPTCMHCGGKHIGITCDRREGPPRNITPPDPTEDHARRAEVVPPDGAPEDGKYVWTKMNPDEWRLHHGQKKVASVWSSGLLHTWLVSDLGPNGTAVEVETAKAEAERAVKDQAKKPEHADATGIPVDGAPERVWCLWHSDNVFWRDARVHEVCQHIDDFMRDKHKCVQHEYIRADVAKAVEDLLEMELKRERELFREAWAKLEEVRAERDVKDTEMERCRKGWQKASGDHADLRAEVERLEELVGTMHVAGVRCSAEVERLTKQSDAWQKRGWELGKEGDRMRLVVEAVGRYSDERGQANAAAWDAVMDAYDAYIATDSDDKAASPDGAKCEDCGGTGQVSEDPLAHGAGLCPDTFEEGEMTSGGPMEFMCGTCRGLGVVAPPDGPERVWIAWEPPEPITDGIIYRDEPPSLPGIVRFNFVRAGVVEVAIEAAKRAVLEAAAERVCDSAENAMCPHCDEVTPVDGKCPNCGRPCDALPAADPAPLNGHGAVVQHEAVMMANDAIRLESTDGAPERVWCVPDLGDIDNGWGPKPGHWHTVKQTLWTGVKHRQAEYIRADVATAEVDRLRKNEIASNGQWNTMRGERNKAQKEARSMRLVVNSVVDFRDGKVTGIATVFAAVDAFRADNPNEPKPPAFFPHHQARPALLALLGLEDYATWAEIAHHAKCRKAEWDELIAERGERVLDAAIAVTIDHAEARAEKSEAIVRNMRPVVESAGIRVNTARNSYVTADTYKSDTRDQTAAAVLWESDMDERKAVDTYRASLSQADAPAPDTSGVESGAVDTSDADPPNPSPPDDAAESWESWGDGGCGPEACEPGGECGPPLPDCPFTDLANRKGFKCPECGSPYWGTDLEGTDIESIHCGGEVCTYRWNPADSTRNAPTDVVPERAEWVRADVALARIAELESVIRQTPSMANIGRIAELERAVEMRRKVCREASQKLIAEVGADGPMSLPAVVDRTVKRIAELERDLDAAKTGIVQACHDAHRERDEARARIAELERAVADDTAATALEEERDTWERNYTEARAEVERLARSYECYKTERDMLRTDRDRMRPVVELVASLMRADARGDMNSDDGVWACLNRIRDTYRANATTLEALLGEPDRSKTTPTVAPEKECGNCRGVGAIDGDECLCCVGSGKDEGAPERVWCDQITGYWRRVWCDQTTAIEYIRADVAKANEEKAVEAERKAITGRLEDLVEVVRVLGNCRVRLGILRTGPMTKARAIIEASDVRKAIRAAVENTEKTDA